MRLLRRNGDPVQVAQADPAVGAANAKSISQQLYGFEDGPVKMRPDMLLNALLLGRGMAKAGSAAAKDILKKGQGKGERVLRALAKEFGSNQLENEAQGLASQVFGLQ